MKLRHELEIHATGRRSATQATPEQANETTVRLKLTLEGARGEPIVGTLEQLMKGVREQLVAHLDRRPY